MAQQLAGLASILHNMQMPPGVTPLIVNLPSPPKLEGALAPNDLLTKVRKHAYNKVYGPESMVVYKGYVYTGQADGWVVEVTPSGAIRKIRRLSTNSCGQPKAGEGACGRPLGIRVDGAGYLVVADAYRGIVQINPRTGQYKQLVNARTLQVNGQPLGYVNDLAVAKDGTIYFTSSSTKWSLAKENNIIFEADRTGRVLVYRPREPRADKQVQELITKLSFPNGIELAKDESYLLVGEGWRSRIVRAWIGPNTPKRGAIELFAGNLPGVVDNIRRTPRGTFWVGLSQARHHDLPSVLDRYGDKPKTRAALINLVNNNVKFDNPKFGIAVELDSEGKVLRSLQDPRGQSYTSVSEVQEDGQGLYLASPGKRFIGYLKIDSLPPPADQKPPSNSSGSAWSPALSTNPKVVKFLTTVRNNMLRMSEQRLKQVVLELVRELIVAKQRNLYLWRVTQERSRAIRHLQEILNQMQAGAGNASSGASPAPGDGAGTTAVTTTVSQPPTTPAGTTAATTAGSSPSGEGGATVPTTATSLPATTATASVEATTAAASVETTSTVAATTGASEATTPASSAAATTAAATTAAATTAAATTAAATTAAATTAAATTAPATTAPNANADGEGGGVTVSVDATTPSASE